MGHDEENEAFFFTEKDVNSQFQKAASRLRVLEIVEDALR